MTDDPAQTFEPYRHRLLGLTYRMTGSVTEAEDVAQDAYQKWHATTQDRSSSAPS
jgi:RNA polymerase sigma-70 factor (ECF subfamily)